MFYEMRLFIGCCVNQEHCWTCHFLLSWQALLGEGEDAPVYSDPLYCTWRVSKVDPPCISLLHLFNWCLYWYNGFSHSVVMESDLFPETMCVGEQGHMPQYCEEADCQSSKKRVIAHLWILAAVSQQEAFFTDAWLSPTSKHMAETRKNLSNRSAQPHVDTHRNRHTSEPHSVWLLFLSVYDLNPPLLN